MMRKMYTALMALALTVPNYGVAIKNNDNGADAQKTRPVAAAKKAKDKSPAPSQKKSLKDLKAKSPASVKAKKNPLEVKGKKTKKGLDPKKDPKNKKASAASAKAKKGSDPKKDQKNKNVTPAPAKAKQAPKPATQDELEQRRAEMNRLQEQNRNLTSQLAEEQAQRTRLEAENQARLLAFERDRQAFEQQRATFDAAQRLAAESTTAMNALRAENQNLMASKTTVEGEKQAALAALDTLRDENTALKIKLAALEATLEARHDLKLEEEAAALRSERNAFAQTQADVNLREARMKTELESKDCQLSDVTNALQRVYADILAAQNLSAQKTRLTGLGETIDIDIKTRVEDWVQDVQAADKENHETDSTKPKSRGHGKTGRGVSALEIVGFLGEHVRGLRYALDTSGQLDKVYGAVVEVSKQVGMVGQLVKGSANTVAVTSVLRDRLLNPEITTGSLLNGVLDASGSDLSSEVSA